MRGYCSRARLSACLTVPILLFSVVSAETAEEAFWQLDGLEKWQPFRNPLLGGQNFTHCCLLAVKEALITLPNQTLAVDPKRANWILTSPDNLDVIKALREASNHSQFPCGAAYNGNPNGAPVVQADYGWVADNCPGWELSSLNNLNTWLQPLSGFLLPAVIFCLSVPRRRKIHVYRSLFAADISGYHGLIPSILGAVGAVVLVTIDTLLWLCICFAFAGPMIISGLYEAMLDNRMLEYLRIKIQHQKLTLDMRCRLLMLILIGNLDLALDEPLDREGTPMPTWAPILNAAQEAPSLSDERTERAGSSQKRPESDGMSLHAAQQVASRSTVHRSMSIQPNTELDNVQLGRVSTSHLKASPWRHMEELLYGIRLFDDDNEMRGLSPRQWPRGIEGVMQKPIPMTKKKTRQINKTKTRLRSMLHSQYSFGTTVGAPVIFFLGGFLFAFLQSLGSLGDEDTAIGLAFGQWYMTVPHIAIVSGLLLAGNNPNILEGVFATERDEPANDSISILGLRFELAYDSCYRVAWQWGRGHTKKAWIKKVIETYGTRKDVRFPGDSQVDSDIMELQTLMASVGDGFTLLSLTILLLGLPCTLAFLTAFYTPEIGLSCRSLTVLIYAIAQISQLFLWMWAYAGPPRFRTGTLPSSRLLRFFGRDGWLDNTGFYQPSSTTWFLEARGPNSGVWETLAKDPLRAFWCFLWYALAGIIGIAAIIAALGGTIMQLIGVYSAGICYMTVDNWFNDFASRPLAVVSTNSELMIQMATQYWKPCAITAIIFMMSVSFAGWWYQRRMRGLFTQLVRHIYSPETETNNPQMLGARVQFMWFESSPELSPARSPTLRPTVVDPLSV